LGFEPAFTATAQLILFAGGLNAGRRGGIRGRQPSVSPEALDRLIAISETERAGEQSQRAPMRLDGLCDQPTQSRGWLV
jgi:hypothetical protein